MLRRLVREIKYKVFGGTIDGPRTYSKYSGSYQAGTGVFASDVILDRGDEATAIYRANDPTNPG